MSSADSGERKRPVGSEPSLGSESIGEVQSFVSPHRNHHDGPALGVEASSVPGLNADDQLLESLGYKPELKREFSPLMLFGMSFSIMSVAPSIASVLTNQLPGGGVGLSWGWLVPCFFILGIGITMSEMASAMPTAGGLYWWTYKFAPKRLKSYLSFLCGYTDTLGLIAGAGSINYGAAQQILSCAQVSTDYSPSDGVIFAVFLGVTIVQCFVGCLPNKIVANMQTMAIVLNMICVFIICIALPIGMKHKGIPLNSGSFVFGDTSNYTSYPYGISFMLTWMAAIWTISSQDACVHMAEEATNASTAVPIGIIGAVVSSSLLGFVILCVIAACIDSSPDGMKTLMNAELPLASIIERCLNKHWATGIMAIFSVVQFMMGLSQLMSTSRQCYAFARDDALPFSRWIKRTTKSQLPIPALIFAAFISVLLGLLILAGDVAANAIFALSVSSLYLAWCIPIFLYSSDWKPLERPGPFYLGHTMSKIMAIVSSAYGAWVIFGLTMIPTDIPVTNASEMNYTCLVCGAVWGFASLYWIIDARKWYDGPKMTLGDEELAEIFEAQEWDNIEDQDSPKAKKTATNS